MRIIAPLGPRPHKDRVGPQRPGSSEAAAINAERGDKDDWLWAYPEPELDPTRPADKELLADE